MIWILHHQALALMDTSAFPPAEVKIIPVPYPFKERSHPHSERQMHNILLQMLQQQGEFK